MGNQPMKNTNTKSAPVSAVVLSRNEEANIAQCLETILWCREIILIDASSDATLKIAKEVVDQEKLKVVSLPESTDFSKLRNLGLKESSNDWVLFVDADQRVSPALRGEIEYELLQDNIPYAGFRIRQLDVFSGRLLKFGETGHTQHILLGKKGAGEWKRRVHEYWDLAGEVKNLRQPMLHYPHPSINEFIEHINRWSTLDAQEFLENGQKPSLRKVLVYPTAKFVQNYLLRLGILDGFPGLLVAFMMSLHSLCVRVKMFSGG
jgi:glycosyltransferase involved in cell wall biosynthesis